MYFVLYFLLKFKILLQKEFLKYLLEDKYIQKILNTLLFYLHFIFYLYLKAAVSKILKEYLSLKKTYNESVF